MNNCHIKKTRALLRLTHVFLSLFIVQGIVSPLLSC